jgi:hypothetical protein
LVTTEKVKKADVNIIYWNYVLFFILN